MSNPSDLPNPSQAQVLIAIADFATIFHSPDGETAYASMEINGHQETWPARSKGFRDWLVRRFFELQKKPPASQALTDALASIEARARFGHASRDVSIRVAGTTDAIYLDLANPKWEVVEVTGEGWRVTSDPPVTFRRAKGMAPLPHPVPGGNLSDLRSFLNLGTEADWILLAAWLVAAVRPTGPYPVLVLHGEQGSAKSTAARVVRALLDPNLAPLRAQPRDERDVMIAAKNAWVLSFDNLSHLPTWLSDALARLATGGGYATRELYSDTDEVIIDVQRPVILNGIEEIVTRADLLDRALILELPAIDEDRRQPEKNFWGEFESARPRLLGALLDAVSTALQGHREVALERLPRLADFAVWATAAELAFGCVPGDFMVAYTGNRKAATALALEACPIVPPLRDLLLGAGLWSGTATELLTTLNATTTEETRRLKAWPKTPNALAGILRRLAPSLRGMGLEVSFDRGGHAGTRRIVLTLKGAGR